MEASAPAREPYAGMVVLMPTPGPLGRMIRYQRSLKGWRQGDVAERASLILAEATGNPDAEIKQPLISRLERGSTQRVNDIAVINALAKAIGFQSPAAHAEFLLAAHAPDILRTVRIVARDEPPPDDEGDPRESAYCDRYKALPAAKKRRIEQAIDFVVDDDEARIPIHQMKKP